MVEVTSGGGKGVWSDSPPAYPVLPGVTLPASSLLSSSPHIPATTQLLTVTGLSRQWGAVHPAARDPPVTLGRIPQWTHIWTLGVTMLAKRNGHDPPPSTFSLPPARVPARCCKGRRRGVNPRTEQCSGGYSHNWRSSYDPSSCSQPGSSAHLRLSPLFCGLSPVILRLVTLLCGTTYTTPQVATAVSGPVTTAECEDWYGAFATCYASPALRTPAPW